VSGKKKSTGALFVAIVALVMGLLGVGAGGMGLLGAIFQEQLAQQQQGLFPMPPEAGEAAELQQRMQEELTDVNRRHRIPLIAHGAMNVLASAALLGAGILLFMWKPMAPMVFVIAAVANLLIDIGGAITGLLVQREMNEIMGRYMSAIATGGAADAPPGMDRMMDGIMQASATAGICFALGWLVLKLGYYAGATLYLRRPAVRALYSPSSS
jgi:hypothetical protein